MFERRVLPPKAGTELWGEDRCVWGRRVRGVSKGKHLAGREAARVGRVDPGGPLSRGGARLQGLGFPPGDTSPLLARGPGIQHSVRAREEKGQPETKRDTRKGQVRGALGCNGTPALRGTISPVPRMPPRP